MIHEPIEPETEERPPISAREIVSIRTTQEELGVARCPLCREVLVARQGRTGPYFHCRCERKPTKRAS
jgi:ssDNA-binding Zn-finger/Zn-ribbon topoisomerase 1